MDMIFLSLMLLPPLAAAMLGAISLFAGDSLLGWRAVQRMTFAAAGLAALGGAGLLASMLADPRAVTITLGEWFRIGGLSVDIAFRLDPLGAVMAALVTGFGFVISRFSINYMHNETGFTRFFATYALFIVAMLVLVLADNLVMMFLGWEGVGLCSYLLIGHYAQRDAAARSATEAFVTNRLGDAALIAGIVVLIAGTGTLRFADLPAALTGAAPWVAPVAALCLLLGAMGKSALFPLGGWLAKAMEGPTPSSALFYGSTMVTAGVYLVVRAHPLFDAAPAVLVLAGILGALTALYGALAGQTSHDIKGLLVSSTSMHLGLMFVACGLGAYGVAIFYVVAHACMKGYQFLTAPSILHHLHGRSGFDNPVAADSVPSGVAVALLAAVALVVAAPVMQLSGASLGLSAALSVMAGGGVLALSLLIWLAVRGVAQALPQDHGHDHGHGHGHDHAHDQAHAHAHDHGHGHGQAPAEGAARLGPAGGAAIAVLLAAAGGVGLQLLPGGAEWMWFHGFLNLPQGTPANGAPGLALLLALVLALLALHSVVSALLLARHVPDRVMTQSGAMRGLYALAFNRFWVDAAVQSRLVPGVLRLSDRLARLDHRLSRLVQQGGQRAAEKTGDAVGWLDGAPRRAAESLPGMIGLHVAEAAQQIETQATAGFETRLGRTSGSMGRMALTVERALGRPAVSVGLIVIVALIALAGA